jgi:hypothetical protein
MRGGFHDVDSTQVCRMESFVAGKKAMCGMDETVPDQSFAGEQPCGALVAVHDR